ncbi:hypothetical protein GCM10023161_08170 [Mycobacterium paraffinicum]|uniref:Uncharacterized protein n=1 Tax=Mycobacterium paraffinicum TaxID=53378 RepID=A0ABP8RBZ5_9MYCO
MDSLHCLPPTVTSSYPLGNQNKGRPNRPHRRLVVVTRGRRPFWEMADPSAADPYIEQALECVTGGMGAAREPGEPIAACPAVLPTGRHPPRGY